MATSATNCTATCLYYCVHSQLSRLTAVSGALHLALKSHYEQHGSPWLSSGWHAPGTPSRRTCCDTSHQQSQCGQRVSAVVPNLRFAEQSACIVACLTKIIIISNFPLLRWHTCDESTAFPLDRMSASTLMPVVRWCGGADTQCCSIPLSFASFEYVAMRAADDDGHGRSGYGPHGGGHHGRSWGHDGWTTARHDGWPAQHGRARHARARHGTYEGRHGILWPKLRGQRWRRGGRSLLLQDTDVSRLAGGQMQLRRQL